MCYFEGTGDIIDLLSPVGSTTNEVRVDPHKVGGVFCYCVTTARQLTDYKVPRQDADEFEPNTTPHVGALALFNYDGIHHVAVISQISGEGIFVQQGNKEECSYTEEWIDWNNPNLTGFWAPQEPSADELMDKIAFCESGGKQHNEDGSIVVSSTNDIGKYQINLPYHAKRAKELGYDLYTEEGNTEYAYLLYSEQGSNPWSASQHCWNDA